jgi:hypothetical protein
MDYGLHSCLAGAGGALAGYARLDARPGISEVLAAAIAGAVHGAFVFHGGVLLGAEPYFASVVAFGWGIYSAIAPAAVLALEAGRDRPTPAGRAALSAMIKTLAAPASTLFGVALGTLFVAFLPLAGGRGRIGFRDGVLTFQAPRENSRFEFKAVTFGAAVIFSCGDDRHPLFHHEQFHTRQYAALGDGLAPVWLTFGVLWGGLTAVASGRMSLFRGVMASDGTVGNPIERGAVRFERGG